MRKIRAAPLALVLARAAPSSAAACSILPQMLLVEFPAGKADMDVEDLVELMGFAAAAADDGRPTPTC